MVSQSLHSWTGRSPIVGPTVLVVLQAAWFAGLVFAQETPNGKTDAAAAGLQHRVPWTTSRITGSPEPPPPYRTEPVFTHLQFNHPTELVQIPGSDRMMLVEEKGKVYTFPARPDVTHADLAIDLAQIPGMERAYGLAFHPQFEQNRYCYLAYVLPPKHSEGTRVSRFKVTATDPPRIDPASEAIVITWLSGGHNGGCLQFGPDGMLYVSTGDGGDSFPPDGLNTGQSLNELLASVLRIDVDHPELNSGKRYAIPRDNPFVDVPGARGEVWAYGLRNPWKMSFDPDGALWAADVGWELWEMLYRVEKGANYGWSVMEGSQPVLGERQRGPTPIVPPTVEHSHTEARSITGGYVYTGQRLPELRGAYIYGDYVTGKIWGLRHDGEKITWKQELVDTPLAIVCFGIDRAGELYIADYDTGTLHRLTKRPATDVNQRFPTKLSETGLFADTARHVPAPGVLPYSINAAAWADGTTAERFVALPGTLRLSVYEKQNVQIGHVKGMWRFPPDGVLAKTVFMSAQGNPRRIETQILHYDGDDWHAYAYLWNDQQTDAELVGSEGADVQLSIGDPSAPLITRRQTYRVAGRTECLLCHTTRGGSIYGFTPAQLNREHDYGGTKANQLRTFAQLNLFEYAVDFDTRPLADPYDESADLNQRARAYLHVNCSHCHLRGGGGSSYFDVRHELPIDKTRLLDLRPSHGTFGIAGAQVVHRGDPTRSVLFYRMAKLGRGRMPHFGSNVVDDAGLRLIGDWIASLGPVGGGSASHKSGDAAIAPVESCLTSTSGALAALRAIDAQQFDAGTAQKIVSAGTAHEDPQVRDLFERFVPEEQRIRRLGSAVQPAELLARPGDAQRGKTLFFEVAGVTCRNCHRIGSMGNSVGPELSGIGRKLTKPQLLESLLEPSKLVDPKYLTWLVETSQGQVHVGLLMAQTDQEVVLRDAQNKEQRIAAADIEVIAPQRQSLMPDLLLRDMTAQDVADLLEFLAGQRSDAPQLALAEGDSKTQIASAITWKIDNLNMIGGHKVTVLGQPRMVDTPEGKAIEFDGVDDGLVVDHHPLAGVKEFTAEVIFRPTLDGPKEQRFFHLQETGRENRILFETRLDGPQWFLDTYIKSGTADATLFADGFKHPIGPWYQAAIIVDGKTMKHYVNGKLELEKPLVFEPQGAGQTSIGVRHNRVFWYKGAIRAARFTPRVLTPDQFLKP